MQLDLGRPIVIEALVHPGRLASRHLARERNVVRVELALERLVGERGRAVDERTSRADHSIGEIVERLGADVDCARLDLVAARALIQELAYLPPMRRRAGPIALTVIFWRAERILLGQDRAVGEVAVQREVDGRIEDRGREEIEDRLRAAHRVERVHCRFDQASRAFLPPVATAPRDLAHRAPGAEEHVVPVGEGGLDIFARVAARDHQDDVALFLVIGDFVVEILAVVVLAARHSIEQFDREAEHHHTGHRFTNLLAVIDRRHHTHRALHRSIVEHVRGVERWTGRTAPVEIDGQVLGDRRGLLLARASLTRRAVGCETGGVLDTQVCVLDRVTGGKEAALDVQARGALLARLRRREVELLFDPLLDKPDVLDPVEIDAPARVDELLVPLPPLAIGLAPRALGARLERAGIIAEHLAFEPRNIDALNVDRGGLQIAHRVRDDELGVVTGVHRRQEPIDHAKVARDEIELVLGQAPHGIR